MVLYSVTNDLLTNELAKRNIIYIVCKVICKGKKMSKKIIYKKHKSVVILRVTKHKNTQLVKLLLKITIYIHC